MAFTQSGLPFASGSQTSYKAAESAAARRGPKTALYLAHLAKAGPRTDHESAAALGLPLSSVNSIRNGAMLCGLVTKGMLERKSTWGRDCSTWVLTPAGRGAVDAMKEIR